MIQKSSRAFTLVELIVVVTILAILATIGFVSYSSYLTGVRDTNRLSQLVSIHDGLALFSTTNSLPIPDDNIEVKVGTGTVGYQGYAGSNTLETLDFTKGGKDPKDDSYFTYFLSDDRKYFQLLAFLEEEENLSTNTVNTSYALDYSNRIPTVYGDKLGVLTSTLNMPVQQVVAGEIDVIATTTDYTIHLTDTDTFTGSGTDLSVLEEIVALGGRGFSIKGNTISYQNPDVSIPKEGLLLELLLNGDAKDNSGQNVEGTENGTISYVEGIDMVGNSKGQALFLDGVVGSYVSIPHSSPMEQQSDSFSWSFWIKTGGDQPDTYARLLAYADTVSSLGNTSGHMLRNWINTDGSRSPESQMPGLHDLQWHHIVYQWDGTTTSLYVDNTFIHSASEAGVLQAYGSAVFSLSTSADPFFGAIDNVRIYDEVLTESQIQQLFQEKQF